jgi:hypothetical protein
MSKKAAEHHRKASEHLTHAARNHGEAAKHHEAGSHEKAAHHAHVARGHVIHSKGHAEDAVKAHLGEHGKKKLLESNIRAVIADEDNERALWPAHGRRVCASFH